MTSSEAFPAGDTVQRFLNTLGNTEVGTTLVDVKNNTVLKVNHGEVEVNGVKFANDDYAAALRD